MTLEKPHVDIKIETSVVIYEPKIALSHRIAIEENNHFMK